MCAAGFSLMFYYQSFLIAHLPLPLIFHSSGVEQQLSGKCKFGIAKTTVSNRVGRSVGTVWWNFALASFMTRIIYPPGPAPRRPNMRPRVTLCTVRRAANSVIRLASQWILALCASPAPDCTDRILKPRAARFPNDADCHSDEIWAS